MVVLVTLYCAPSRAAAVVPKIGLTEEEASKMGEGEFTEEELKTMCKSAADTETDKDVVEIKPHNNLVKFFKKPFDIIKVGTNTPVICVTSMVAKAIILKNNLEGSKDKPNAHEISLEFQSGKKLSDYGDQTLGHYQGFKKRKEQSANQGDTDADVGTVTLWADIRRPHDNGDMTKKQKGKGEKALEKIVKLVSDASAIANGETKLAEIEANALKKDGKGYVAEASAMELRLKAIETDLLEIQEHLGLKKAKTT